MNVVHWFVTCDSKFEESSDRNCGCPAESDAQDIAGVAVGLGRVRVKQALDSRLALVSRASVDDCSA